MLTPGDNSENLYESAKERGEFLSEEAVRLQMLDYPTTCSVEVIGDIPGMTLLDVGAGENTSLGEWAAHRRAHYLALDIRHSALLGQREAGATAVVGSIDHLPFPARSVAISHVRFVLGHFAPTRRGDIISELMRVTKERIILLDYDWSGWQGNADMETFKQVAAEVAAVFGFQPQYGAKLKSEVTSALGKSTGVAEQSFCREPGTYYDEILGLAASMRSNLERFGHRELMARLDQVSQRLEEERSRPDPATFTTPDIVAVTIDIKSA